MRLLYLLSCFAVCWDDAMPSLDVNDAFDPSFLDTIVVIRQYQTVNDKGRVIIQTKAMSTLAVVTAASPNDLAFVPEFQHQNKAISIYTPFRLQGVSPETVADTILWHNAEYSVNFLEDYSGYGRGFVHAVAVSVTTPNPGEMAYGNA
jgi:galactose-6-phosphate isomerase